MASVKVKFRPSTVVDKEGTIYYQVIHNRVIRQIKTDYRVFREEWNEKSGVVILSANGLVVDEVYVLQNGKCTNFADDSGKQTIRYCKKSFVEGL